MTARSERRGKRPLAPSRAPLPLAALGVFVLAAVSGPAPAFADSPTGGHQGKILSMRTVRTGRLISYDITVTSPDEFPMRDEIVTLSLGGQTFSNSHYIPGGDQNTLVFSLTQKQFQSLPTGAAAIVYYGQDDAAIPKAQWVLGTSDKSILDKIQVGNPIVISSRVGDSIAASPIAARPDALTSRVKTGQKSAPNAHAVSPHAATPQKGKK